MLETEPESKTGAPKTLPLRLLDDTLSEAFELRKGVRALMQASTV